MAEMIAGAPLHQKAGPQARQSGWPMCAEGQASLRGAGTGVRSTLSRVTQRGWEREGSDSMEGKPRGASPSEGSNNQTQRLRVRNVLRGRPVVPQET